MRKNGFTLVELLAVLIILAIIFVISVPLMTEILDQSKNTLYKKQIDTIEQAINSEELSSLIALINYPGIGIKTMECCFKLVPTNSLSHYTIKSFKVTIISTYEMLSAYTNCLRYFSHMDLSSRLFSAGSYPGF